MLIPLIHFDTVDSSVLPRALGILALALAKISHVELNLKN